MARKVLGPKPNQVREFVPESFDNRQDPEPVTVWIKDPSEGEKRQLVALQHEMQGDQVKLNADLSVMVAWQTETVRKHVTKVSNYSMRGVEITGGAQLADHGESEILAEVALEIFTASSLDEDEKKQSSERSVCSTAAIQVSGGTADNATSSSNSSQEIAMEYQVTASCM